MVIDGINVDKKLFAVYNSPALFSSNLPYSSSGSLNMPAALSKKSHKHKVTPYSWKPGPTGLHPQNQPESASKKIKQPSKQLTNHDWLTIFTWMDAHLGQLQKNIVDHFTSQEEGSLNFDQAALSRRLKRRGDIEVTVKANPAALSARRQWVVVSPEVERALMLWVQDMLANGHVVNGPVLVAKRKILEDKFNVTPKKLLSNKGSLQSFYKA
jgi:hypothetical protein